MTYAQVEARKEKAVRFLRDVVGDDDRADEVEDESVEDYATRKRLVIENTAQRRVNNVANGNDSMTKADMADVCDQVQDILSDAYTPESSREDLAAAIGDALDLLENGPADDTDTDGSEADDTDDQG